MENGIKYNKHGGTLNIRLQRDEDNVLLHVTDSGVGIPEDSLGHIFERFYRVDKARSRETGGTGLGLAIAKQIMNQLGGNISIASDVGEGTEVIISVPI